MTELPETNPIESVKEVQLRVLSIPVLHEEEIHFCSNKISNTKYSILTFIPKNLLEQFRRVANFYFLMIAILASLPFSPTIPFGSWTSLCFVLVCNMVKEIYEDIKRYRQDREINLRKCTVFNVATQKFEEKEFQDIKVGSVVKILKNEEFPADLILLQSSLAHGIAYVETSNLDGELNLKTKSSLSISQKTVHSEKDIKNFSGKFTCEAPNPNLYQFHGNFLDKWATCHPLEIENLLLRGTKLRNTDWILGITIFTGHQTKSALNTCSSPFKSSKMETVTNAMVAILLFFELSLSITAATVGTWWEHHHAKGLWYLGFWDGHDTPFTTDWLENFASYIVVFANIVPIAMYVSMEIVRVAQALMINWDQEISCGKFSAQCRNSNLNEELGQIGIVFSDKTGTLTCNSMKLTACSLYGKIYGEGTDVSLTSLPLDSRFIQILTCCNTLVLDGKEYSGNSPDEIELGNFAKNSLGVSITERTMNSIVIERGNFQEKFRIEAILPFSSERKRMSIVIRDTHDNLILLTKGADNVILPLIQSSSFSLRNTTSKHLEIFSSNGLRTLVLAFRTLDPKEFSNWKILFDKASVSLTNRDMLLSSTCSLLEKDLELVGATAIEDKLQEFVPETIMKLHEASMKIWVLTGDKKETALSVCKSSKIIPPCQPVYFISGESRDEISAEISEIEKKVRKVERYSILISGTSLALALVDFLPELEKLKIELGAPGVSRFLFYLRRKLASFRTKPAVPPAIVQILLDSDTVVCFRTTPLQKSLVVQMVRYCRPDISTLAIGDGANDVSMILSANVGVGIVGNEGMQAALSSDYVINRFCFLQKLLLVHGQWNYRRLSEMIFFIVYKSIAYVVTQIFWSYDVMFSAQIMFEPLWGQCYQLIFTSVPILVFAITDQFAPKELLLSSPKLYKDSRNGINFNKKILSFYIVSAVVDGLFCYLFWRFLVISSLSFSGKLSGMWALSIAVFGSVVAVVSFRLMFDFSSWNVLTHLAVWGSFVVFAGFATMYDYLTKGIVTGQSFHILNELATCPSFWLNLILVLSFLLFVILLGKFIKVEFFSSETDIAIREFQKKQRAKVNDVSIVELEGTESIVLE